MFAIIEDGSRQFKVSKGSLIKVDYREDAEAGENITFGSVLLANAGGSSSIGAPLIDGASVVAEVVDPEFKGEKLEVQKFRRRKNSRRHTGHRQKYTTVKIAEITVPGLEEKKEG
ncbi:MAG: 50S ribosomal protein L21 [Planctomyces sp.]|nr:50S ribosomal protein L21 [Planctomyces sp.]